MKIKEGDITLDVNDRISPLEIGINFRNAHLCTLGEMGIVQLYNAILKLLNIAKEKNADKTATKPGNAGKE